MTNNYNPDQKRGGPANAGNWTKYENSDPEAPLGSPAKMEPLTLSNRDFTDRNVYGPITTPAEAVQPGDAFYTDAPPGGKAYRGTVLRVVPHPRLEGNVRIVLSSGDAYAALPGDEVGVVRSEKPRRYNPEADYYEKLGVLAHPRTTEETLAVAVAYEAEDDFMVVIAGHPNSGPQTIELASRHSSAAVRFAAISNPDCHLDTLVRIQNEALEQEQSYTKRIEREGINPMTVHYKAMIAEAVKLDQAAIGEILRRHD